MRVALVGCGHVCGQHLEALRRVPAIEVVAVCDRNGASAARLAQAHGIGRHFEDLGRLLEEVAPDVVHVLTPPASHRDITFRAIAAGCHVLVEKPMATNAADASDMRDAAQAQGVRLGVCHNYCFVPAFLEAKARIERGELGKVLSVEAFWRMSSYAPRSDATLWMRDLPGGVFQEVAPHVIALLQSVAGELSPVAAVARPSVTEASELRALLASPAGPVALGISLGASPVQKFVRVYGTRQCLHVDLATSTLRRIRAARDGVLPRALVNLDQAAQLVTGTLSNGVRLLLGRLPRGHETLVARFYEALRQGGPLPASADEGVAVVAVLDRLWEVLDCDRVPVTRAAPRPPKAAATFHEA